ncbi:Alpha/Beta hydrolase protein [Dipodascopsis uninucleata]
MSVSAILESTTWQLNGHEFHVETARPADGEIIANVLLIHGFGEYCGRYTDMKKYFADNKIGFLGFDQRGSGFTCKSRKEQGVTNEKLVFDDLDAVIEKADIPNSTVPWYMLGISMGGGITLNYMVIGKYRESFSGYIGGAPLIGLSNETKLNPLKYYLLRKVLLLFPGLQFDTKLNFDYFSRDPEHVEKSKKDKDLTAIGTLRLIADMLDRGTRLLDPKFIENIIDRPLVICHGTGDKINSYDDSKKFIEIANLSDKSLFTYDDAYHELQNEIKETKEKFLADITSWIIKHVPSSTPEQISPKL